MSASELPVERQLTPAVPDALDRLARTLHLWSLAQACKRELYIYSPLRRLLRAPCEQAWGGCGQKKKRHGRLGDSFCLRPPPFIRGRIRSVPNCSGEALFGFSYSLKGGGVHLRSGFRLHGGGEGGYLFGLFWFVLIFNTSQHHDEVQKLALIAQGGTTPY
ncbi:uncharacterized protein NECHADRAFT_81301 [Fusarium vanettenii 77-13-4]|uniref:Uncharacterized protein n=1 Tax=Fusarium vanettenii (strain ATCC MYA-4622 / CBS 123669 / FGSC 9596 / NRRL 45880 / 77-13-4) TaxID=660122 RepID=C7ZHU2_FUSV7|nr:uncharacterized protein NECHADRAFT_81301 [Fusarium vanettenii 77-13-4]EEU36495.1 predicted protein [Fusarium vanettenii 77-13-4]